ncbi:putative HNH endonuclease [Bacillus phage vB_BspM_AgentSmith]|nr:putative HNH endonuclease [Bacillus phage vB_BspM_AgentSmith]
MLYQQFILRQAVKNSMYLINPPVMEASELTVPRYTVLHYLDTTSDRHFPDRELYYFKEIEKNKKIPILHVTDLLYKEDVTVLENKYVGAEVRKWGRSNIKSFRGSDLDITPNSSVTVIGVYNYNLLKDMYKYKTTLLSDYNEHQNLYRTYWDTIKKAVDLDQESRHLVTIELPVHVPSYNVLKRLIQFTPVKYSRVVKDDKLKTIIELVKWLDPQEEGTSVMSKITEEDSLKIIIEFKYKGYSCIVPLSTLMSVHEKSTLESSIKMGPIKALKLFIVFLRRIQDRVVGITDKLGDPLEIEDKLEVDQTEETTDAPEGAQDYEGEDSGEDDETPSYRDRILPIASLAPKRELVGTVIDKLSDIGSVPEIPKYQFNQPKKITIPAIANKVLKKKDISDDDIFVNRSADIDVDQILKEMDEEVDGMDEYYEQAIMGGGEDSPDTFNVDYSDNLREDLLRDIDLDSKYENFVATAKEFNSMSSSELRSVSKSKEKRATLKSPYAKDIALDTYTVPDKFGSLLDSEAIGLNEDIPHVSSVYKQDVLKAFDDNYLKKQYKKDIVANVVNLEKAGVIISDYEVEEVNTSTDNYEVHRLSIRPLNGKESTVLFRLPKIDSEGKMRSGNIITKLRKVRTDLPIRKITPTKVALSSNYGKFFVFRTERSAYDPYKYYVDFIKNSYLDEDGLIKKVVPRRKSLNTKKFPNVYAALTSEFNEVQTEGATLLLDYENRHTFVDELTHKDLETKNLLLAGYLNGKGDRSKNILVVDMNNKFYNYTNNMELVGTLEDVLGMDVSKTPKPFSMVKVLGDNIALGLALSYYVGLNNLLAITKTEFKLLGPRERYTPEKGELVLRFSDHKLVIITERQEQELLFNGFLFYENYTKQHELVRFNNKDIYLGMVELRNSGMIHLKEMDLLRELFLDPITIDVLKEMEEPHEYIPLLLKANKLLETLDHPDINDPRISRIRGYDRVPGLMYKVLTESVREHRIKGRKNSKIELDPYKVWNYVLSDNTTKITEETNPVVDLKEKEVITFTGKDGMSASAIPMKMRSYHEEDIGLMSEATVDSKDVAISAYLSPHAKIKNTRGMVLDNTDEYIKEKGTVFSTSALLAPMVENDDPKRINFVNIQNGHTISAVGYVQPTIRTGYEYVMPYRVGPLYASMAEEDGEVVSVTDKQLVVKYKSGEVKAIKVGTQYGRMEGSVYPHSLVTDLTPGKKFKKDVALAYNENFFEKDWLDSTKLLMKFGKNISVALTANDETYEDSCSVSDTLSEGMTTSIIKEKIFIIESTKNIINLVPIGSKVDPNTPLFSIVDETTDYNNLSETSVDLLQNLATMSPRAKVYGEVERYEIKYNGELADMSPTFRKLANKLDKDLFEETKGTEYEAKNNRITAEYRSEGKNLNVDTLELKIYVTVQLGMGIGD